MVSMTNGVSLWYRPFYKDMLHYGNAEMHLQMPKTYDYAKVVFLL